jgi:transcriptional regulator with XRE-family HTH domain
MLRLAEIRKAQGHTRQADVASLMGVSQARVSKLESGDLSHTELGTLQSYVTALGGSLRVVADFDRRKQRRTDVLTQDCRSAVDVGAAANEVRSHEAMSAFPSAARYLLPTHCRAGCRSIEWSSWLASLIPRRTRL